ncbi:Selenoprotein O [Tetrabaena socialis]|uniref:Selenoprotein O n=1 Tax=Tetrabaena socialis TaxID=47790 RepID=A0A2J7ZUZ5_9CHLO|nr:Selenoprotein O [Tetrabaena socialis]|eukprot:PNH04070.1 Selenoprotein O [Tetrabaena socialis]
MAAPVANAVTQGRKKLEELSFDNLTLRSLPLDPVEGGTLRQVEGACFSRVQPTPLSNPQLVVASTDALALLDLDPAEPGFSALAMRAVLRGGAWNCEKLVEAVKAVVPEARGKRAVAEAFDAEYRRCYLSLMRCKLGLLAPALHDLPEVEAADEVLVAELLEAMAASGSDFTNTFRCLSRFPVPPPGSDPASPAAVQAGGVLDYLLTQGVPTTRAGSVVTSDTRVVRDIHYDGNAIRERATVITRIAPTFLRFGSFEIFKPTDSATGRRGPSAGQEALLLPAMLHHTIRTYFPHIWAQHDGDAIAAGVGWVYELLRNPFSEADVSELLSSAAASAGASSAAVTDESAAASAAAGGAAAQPAAAASDAVSCSLPEYDGRPPEWAAKLCITCSS